MPYSVRNILFYFVAHISHVLLYNESCVFVKKSSGGGSEGVHEREPCSFWKFFVFITDYFI